MEELRSSVLINNCHAQSAHSLCWSWIRLAKDVFLLVLRDVQQRIISEVHVQVTGDRFLMTVTVEAVRKQEHQQLEGRSVESH